MTQFNMSQIYFIEIQLIALSKRAEFANFPTNEASLTTL